MTHRFKEILPYHEPKKVSIFTRISSINTYMKQLNTLVLDVTIYILDFLYRGRDFQRFWVLEVIARAPYFSFISVLHFRESLGLRGEDHIYLMKEHFYQALNETEHLEEMELREGNKYWIDRFFAKHLVLVYYWIMVGYYLIDPTNAYDINMKIEAQLASHRNADANYWIRR